MKRKRIRRRRTNRTIMAAARKKYARQKNVDTTVKGIACTHCGSRDTKTECYRWPPMRGVKFGVTACNACGAS